MPPAQYISSLCHSEPVRTLAWESPFLEDARPGMHRFENYGRQVSCIDWLPVYAPVGVVVRNDEMDEIAILERIRRSCNKKFERRLKDENL